MISTKSRLLAGAALTLTATGAAAQSGDNPRIAALETRIAQLESQVQEEEDSTRFTFGAGVASTVEVYGYIKTDFFYDFDQEMGNTTFPLYTLPSNGPEDGYFGATINQTRLGLNATTPTAAGDLNINIETDFYGGVRAYSTGDEGFRLRAASGEIAGFLVGKEWTTFLTVAAYPITLDFQGVAGIPFARQEQIRYTFDITDTVSADVAIEESNASSDDPSYVAAIAYDTDPLLVRLSGIYGRVNGATNSRSNPEAEPVETPFEDVESWGLSLATSASLWEGATLNAAYTYGKGIASYMVFLGQDIDENGDPIELHAAYAGLTQEVGDSWTLRGIIGYRENESGQLGITRAADGSILSVADDTGTKSLTSYHFNAQYEIVENTVLGIEYFHGEVDRFDSDDFSVDRLQTAVTFNF